MKIDAFGQGHVFCIKHTSSQSFEIFVKIISPHCEAILQALEAVEKSVLRMPERVLCAGGHIYRYLNICTAYIYRYLDSPIKLLTP